MIQQNINQMLALSGVATHFMKGALAQTYEQDKAVTDVMAKEKPPEGKENYTQEELDETRKTMRTDSIASLLKARKGEQMLRKGKTVLSADPDDPEFRDAALTRTMNGMQVKIENANDVSR